MSIKTEALRRQAGDRSIINPSSPAIVSPTRRRRKVTAVDATTESIRSLVRTNQQMSAALKVLVEQRRMMVSKIQQLEGEIVRDHDLVATLRERVSSLSTPSCFTDTKSMNSGAHEVMSMGSAQDFQEFIHNHPLIMKGFTGSKPGFKEFVGCCQKVPKDAIMDVVGESMNQLYKLAKCFEVFEKMKKAIEDACFVEQFEGSVKALFMSPDVKVLLFDRVSNEYAWNRMSLDLKSKCLLQKVVRDQDVCIVERPKEHSDFDEKVDGGIVTELPVLFIPIESEAVIAVSGISLGNCEIEIGKFARILWGPLISEYNQNSALNREIAFRRVLHRFEVQILSVTSRDELMERVFRFLMQNVGPSDVKVFIVKPDAFRLFEAGESGKVTEKDVQRAGIVSVVAEKHDHFEVERLDKDVDGVDVSVDEWALGSSFVALPVTAYSHGGVIAVLCLKGRQNWNKFTGWDVSCASAVCSILSVTLPGFLLDEDKGEGENKASEFDLFLKIVSQLTVKSLEEPESVRELTKSMQTIVPCEWISVHAKADAEITEIITLHGEKVSDTCVIDKTVVASLFEDGKDVCGTDGLEATAGVKVQSHICALNKDLIVVAVNSTSGSFDPSHMNIWKAFLSLVEYALAMKAKNDAIAATKRDNMMTSNMLQVAESLLSDSNPLPKLLNVTTELLSMDSYLLLRHCPMQEGYKVLLPSNGALLPLTDAFIAELQNVSCNLYKDFPSSDFAGSAILSHLPKCKDLVALSIDEDNWTVLVFGGQSVVSNFELLLNAFMKPLLRIYVDCYDLGQAVDFIPQAELEKVHFFNSEVNEADLSSLSFSVANYTSDQTIEVLLMILTKLGLHEFLGVSLEKVASFFVHVKHLYRHLPFHNWNHAVDCAQMVYLLVTSSQAIQQLSRVDILALFLAAVCHDIDHDGFDSVFHHETCSPLFFAHGESHCQERHHVSVALHELREHLISEQSELNRNHHFWESFVQTILSTDPMEDKMNMEKFAAIAADFDPSDDEQSITIAKLLLKVANSASCFRSFENARISAENLEKELRQQFETAKSLGFNMDEPVPLPSLESGFIENTVLPCVRCLITLDPEFEFLEAALTDNLNKWKSQ